MVTNGLDVRHVVAWLPPVRWATCAVLWGMLAVAWLFPQIDPPVRAIAFLVLAAAICRTAVVAWLHANAELPRWLPGFALVIDAALLTGLLDITGGPFNPFIVMYVVYVWLGAVYSSAVWGTLVALVSVASFGWLVVDHLQPGIVEHHRLNDFPTHLFTMWLSGAAIAELVGHYVGRAGAVLAERQRSLEDARDRAARSEHLASLTTLAAGAAHELSTPLATIAVAARELERSAAQLSEPDAIVDGLKDDARLIRMEVDRCTVILDGMSGRAGNGPALTSPPFAINSIMELALGRLTDDQQQRLRVAPIPEGTVPGGAGFEMSQALASLIKNAFEASGPSDEVVVRCVQHGSQLRIEVRDCGTGMSIETRRRAGEPFFTTKEPGRGLGLGVFLARTIAERAGGSLSFEGERGTTAVLQIPVAVTAESQR